MKTVNVCRQCGKRYTAKRQTSKFDSTKCRVAYNRDVKGRILIITQNKEDEMTMLKWFDDTKRRVVRKFTTTDTKFLIDFDYWEELTGLELTESDKTKHDIPKIISNAGQMRNKLARLIQPKEDSYVTLNNSNIRE